ncbi:ABC transporter permease [Prosthecomicrobium sp. N25]|uniref:ABC transporter permease n=1 Tax=Prosthecomicrobium sp. N25 TaxID=3129254 RepID=UPI0030785A95
MPVFDARRLLPFIGPVLFFALWYVVVANGLVNKILFPSPVDTVAHLFGAFGKANMQGDIWATFARTATAFAFAAAVGVPIGVALGSSEAAYRSVEFLIDFFRSTPSSALIPLFLLLFGITDANKIAIAAFAAFLVILFNSAYGVMNARKTRILAARVMGANAWQIFKDVLIWESLSQTFVGLRTGVSIALVIVIVAEMFIGSENGLGHRIIDAQQVLNVKDMYASILVTGALGYLLNLAFLLVEKRFIHWSGK